jgi:hypothetical protein
MPESSLCSIAVPERPLETMKNGLAVITCPLNGFPPALTNS